MSKNYTALGLMSGTSGDGVDASVIKSNGKDKYEVVVDKYFAYDKKIYDSIHESIQSIDSSKDLIKLKNALSLLEKNITFFHAKVVENFTRENIDFIGFHGQTIYHNPKEKISRQLGDGKLLSQLTKRNVVYNFRENDLKNNGQGAPLTPIFHKLIINQNKIKKPISILNIGGISNITSLDNDNRIFSSDLGPGNCLIDKWMRINSKKNYDDKGIVAQSGTINKIILDQALDNFYNNEVSNKRSYDIKDFDLAFVRGLSLEDGAATLTEFTSQIICREIVDKNILICGGGRKNNFLLECIRKKVKGKIELIDTLNMDGDFIESQAFAYLAIRSFLKLPISFPETTGCKHACSGGNIVYY